jgi:hypothetical protein
MSIRCLVSVKAFQKGVMLEIEFSVEELSVFNGVIECKNLERSYQYMFKKTPRKVRLLLCLM